MTDYRVKAQEVTAASPGSANQELKHEVLELVVTVVLFVFLFVALRCFVIEGYEVQGESMEPTLCNQQRILVLKLPHKLTRLNLFGFSPFGEMEAIKTGDIVVFDSPDDPRKRYVKRVVARGQNIGAHTVDAGSTGEGAAGDVVLVHIDEGDLFVNNSKVEEDYLPEEVEADIPSSDECKLDKGQYYVLGDNRKVSKDSRSFGAVEDDKLIGKAVLRFWPLTEFSLLR